MRPFAFLTVKDDRIVLRPNSGIEQIITSLADLEVACQKYAVYSSSSVDFASEHTKNKDTLALAKAINRR